MNWLQEHLLPWEEKQEKNTEEGNRETMHAASSPWRGPESEAHRWVGNPN